MELLQQTGYFKWISDDIAELAALAQHYGVLTRLIDWAAIPHTEARFSYGGRQFPATAETPAPSDFGKDARPYSCTSFARTRFLGFVHNHIGSCYLFRQPLPFIFQHLQLHMIPLHFFDRANGNKQCSVSLLATLAPDRSRFRVDEMFSLKPMDILHDRILRFSNRGSSSSLL